MTDFSALYQKHAPEVFRFALYLSGNRGEAEDIASETFVRAWTSSAHIEMATLRGYLAPRTEFVYLPLRQHPVTRVSLLAESQGDPAALVAPLRDVIRAIDPGMPVFGVRTMADLYDQRSVRVARIIDGIVGCSGLIGLSLALVGLYAVVAYQVARRTREIGIRVALGADRPMVMKLVLRQALWIGVTGVAIGMVLSFASGQALHAGLGSPAFDPLVFGLFPAGLLLTVLLAAAIPARRAARIDPMQALREE